MKHPLISPPGVFGGFAKRRFELYRSTERRMQCCTQTKHAARKRRAGEKRRTGEPRPRQLSCTLEREPGRALLQF